MLARLAENLYQAGRSLERAEATARLVDVTYHALLESPTGEVDASWHQLFQVLGPEPAASLEPVDDPGPAVPALPVDDDPELDPVHGAAVLRTLVLDRHDPRSVRAAVTQAREHLRSVRELVSTELWDVVNDLHLEVTDTGLARDLLEQPASVLGGVRRACLTIYGVASETMPRDDSWRFLALGRVLQRAEMTCRVLDVREPELAPEAGPPSTVDLHQWVAVLRSVAALDAYRRRYRASIQPADVVEFLLLEPDLPRSVVFCLTGARNQLEALARGRSSRAVRELGRATASLTYRDVGELYEIGLHGFLDDIQARLARVDTAITNEFFRHHPMGALHAIASP